MKTILKVLVCFAIGIAIATQADAFTLRQVRSLAAVGAVQNGNSFSNPPAGQVLLPPQGGGLQWQVFVTASAPNLTFQIQGQLTDGTWVPISPAPGTNPNIICTGTLPATGQNYSFLGPFQDVRVAITAWTSGTLTADIFVLY